MQAPRRTPLLELDPDFGALIPADRRAVARRELGVEVDRLPRGPWAGGADTDPEHVGILLLEGVMSREVVVSDTVSAELLGPGDVVRPWRTHEQIALLQRTIRWTALTETRVALLDDRFGAMLGRWPEVNAVLIDRVNVRAHRIATTQAISQLTGVDRRVLSLLWHLAERWGRMTPDGVLVPLTLSHRILGQLVGARRPTVTSAVAHLVERGELARRVDGTWLLKGEAVSVPEAEPERIVPIRRKLLGRRRDADALPRGFQALEPVLAARLAEPPTLAPPLMELRAKLAQLRGETQLRVDDLATSRGESRRLFAVTVDARERRARQREAWASRRA